jgi:hypothetical protein
MRQGLGRGGLWKKCLHLWLNLNGRNTYICGRGRSRSLLPREIAKEKEGKFYSQAPTMSKFRFQAYKTLTVN